MTWDATTITALGTALVVVMGGIGKLYVDIRRVHRIVNSRLTEALNRIEALRDEVNGLKRERTAERKSGRRMQ